MLRRWVASWRAWRKEKRREQERLADAEYTYELVQRGYRLCAKHNILLCGVNCPECDDEVPEEIL